MNGVAKSALARDPRLLETLRVWQNPALETFICSFSFAPHIRSKVCWTSIQVMDLHGVEYGFTEQAVEEMLYLAVALKEFTVGVDAKSGHVDIPDTSFVGTGRPHGALTHTCLKTLWIKHIIDMDPFLLPHPLLPAARFPVLEELHYTCTAPPHHNDVAWMTQPLPSLTLLHLEIQYIDLSSITRVLHGLPSLKNIHLSSTHMPYVNSPTVIDNGILDALNHTPLCLETVMLSGLVYFTVASFTDFGVFPAL